jgi:predicted acetyltransferase
MHGKKVKKMNIELREIQLNEKEILRNLWQFYDYDDKDDVNESGLFDCKALDYYWTKENKWMYFVTVDRRLAGFVMLTNIPEIEGTETDWAIGEFFIMLKYRRSGVGRQVFLKVLDKHKGRVQLSRHPENIPAVHFWEKVISEYTKGHYELVKSHPKAIVYDDGVSADVYFFKSQACE